MIVEHNSLIAQNAVGLINFCGVKPSVVRVLFEACHEKRMALMDNIESAKINIPSIQYIKTICFVIDLV